MNPTDPMHRTGSLDGDDFDTTEWPEPTPTNAEPGDNGADIDTITSVAVPPVDYYGILNVDRSSTEEDIKNAYKRLCIAFHPDKFIDETQKTAAHRKFQLVQRAYDILSDQNKRHIYDLYGEGVVDQSWVLGPRLKSRQEIREEYERRKRIKAEMDAQNLVKSRGEILLEFDASPMFDGRAARLRRFRGGPRIGLPIVKRNFIDFFVVPELRKASVSHTWETQLGNQTDLILNGVATTRNGIGGASVDATIRHALGEDTWGEFTAVVGQQPSGHVKITREIAPDIVASVSGTMNTIHTPPHLRVFLTRRITPTTSGFIAYRPGLFNIGSWGPDDPQTLGNSSCMIGMTHRKSKRQWDCQIEAGRSESHITLSHTRVLPNHVYARADLSVSTSSALRFGISTDRRVDRTTRIGMGIQYTSTGTISLRLRVSRLGQKFSLPVLMSSEASLRMAILAFSVPVLVVVAVDQFVLYPWRKRMFAAAIERVRQENAEILEERRQDGLQAIELMREAVARRVESEETRNGLVILQALYGKLPPSEHDTVRALSPQGIRDMANKIRQQIRSVLTTPVRSVIEIGDVVIDAVSGEETFAGVSTTDGQPTRASITQATGNHQPSRSDHYIDVTIPVQSLVHHGQLHISGGHSKSNLIGFWDPVFGERKRLRITYQFQGRIHQVEVDDKASVAAPLRAHLVS